MLIIPGSGASGWRAGKSFSNMNVLSYCGFTCKAHQKIYIDKVNLLYDCFYTYM